MAEKVDLSKFRRTGGMQLMAVPIGLGHGRLTVQAELHTIAQLGYGMDPRSVPVSALQLMSCNPAVYLAERTISGIMRRPDLYSVRHDDPRILAEVEAWLWPLLPALTAAAARGFAYGTVAVVLDWERKTLRVLVPSGSGKPRNKTLQDHTHYRAAFEAHPDECEIELDEQGLVASVRVIGGSYSAERAQVWAWDPEFGSPLGQGARRRAWRSYCEHMLLTVLRDKYLERSVDSPRVAFVPDGTITVDGVVYEIPDYVNMLLEELRGSGSVALPGKRDASGNRLYEVDTLEIPDRADVWDQALARAESEIYRAYLVSPKLSGVDDAGGGESRTIEGMLREHVEDLANWVAEGLTRLAQIVHSKNYDSDKVEPPEIVATDVGKQQARKIMQEVLRLTNAAPRGEVSLRTDVPALLDRLGIPLRDEPPEFPEGWGDEGGDEVGRPRDPMGDREQRREDAETEQGEDDTGGEDVEREEREAVS